MLKIEKKTVKAIFLLTLALAAFHLPLNTDSSLPTATGEDPEALAREQEWVDQKFASLTPDERIGQLFMIRAHSNLGPDHVAAVERLIKDYHVGGLCFFQGTPEKQVELINRYQKLAKKVPIMVSMDAEWGLGMRFKDDAISYPRQLMLGAIQDNALIYDMGKEVARELRRVGVHINFAPVVDVNNNPNNPVINDRSFGEDRYNVAAKSYMYMKGMQDNKVMACAKHFPGHGDTDVDSHLDLPRILHNRQRLDSIEMFPFQVLSQHGVQSVMVAHLDIPAIDNTPNLPTTLSQKAVTDILKGEMGFEGLIFTDGLGMKGVTKHHPIGDLEVKALQAGNDVLLLPENTPAAYKKIKEAMANGSLDSTMVNNSVRKILHAKYRLGLTSFTPISKENVRADVTGWNTKNMKRKLIENSLTLVRNKDYTVPFSDTHGKKVASVAIGASSGNIFQHYLAKYGKISTFQRPKNFDAPALIRQLATYDEVIVSLHGMSSRASKGFGVSQNTKDFIAELQTVTNVTIIVFGNPYSLKYFDNVGTVLECYDDGDVTQRAAAEALFGVLPITGRLPVTASAVSKYGDGVDTKQIMRLRYDEPEVVGMSSGVLTRIDGIAKEAIDAKALPGMQVLVAKDGRVVFHKAYGYHTYKKQQPVSPTDIYDVASVTKVAATTVSLMKLHDEGKLNLNSTLGKHLEAAKGTNKENLIVRDILAHHARLKAWIPFYKETVTSSKRPSTRYYKKNPSGKYSVPVTNNLFMDEGYKEQIWKQIFDSELRSSKSYKYSDLGFYLMMGIIEENTGKSLDEYVQENFYGPLGMKYTGFNPLQKFGKEQIPPTERDKYFRQETIQGHVHDMGAAMMGGVCGHAGLFSSANDLAILFQMLLNDGNYGGKQYIRPETIRAFTSRYYSSTRRGIGFDMKETNSSRSQNTCSQASWNCYGHTGFTGTCVWVDPDHDLIYIFLSNRTYPSMNNYKINKMDIRERVQEVVYQSMVP